jgi:hypothetical protein
VRHARALGAGATSSRGCHFCQSDQVPSRHELHVATGQRSDSSRRGRSWPIHRLDPEAELDIDSYGNEATRQGVALWGSGGGITVFTASHWTKTLVTVALHDKQPGIDIDQWDHVAEAGLSIRSARLHLYGPEDTNLHEASVVMPSGTYSVIVSGRGFDTTNEYGDEGTDTYALHLWPGPRLQRRVLKDGFTWMD